MKPPSSTAIREALKSAPVFSKELWDTGSPCHSPAVAEVFDRLADAARLAVLILPDDNGEWPVEVVRPLTDRLHWLGASYAVKTQVVKGLLAELYRLAEGTTDETS